jgi:hypothetical protein
VATAHERAEAVGGMTEETLRQRVAELESGLAWIIGQIHEAGHINEGVRSWRECMRGTCRTATRLLAVPVKKRVARQLFGGSQR